MMKSFTLSLAGRYEDYSDFGDTFNPKIGFNWAPNDDFTFRGSYSESFRAPTLSEVNEPPFLTVSAFPSFFITGFPVPPQSAAAPPGTTITAFNLGGAPGLSEETAEAWTVGLEYSPSDLPGVTLSATYYSITYDNRLETINPTAVLENPALSELLELDPGAARMQEIVDVALGEPGGEFNNPFGFLLGDVQVLVDAATRNLALREVEGIDFLIDYLNETNLGTFSASLNLDHKLTFDSKIRPMSPVSEDLDVLYRPTSTNLRSTFGWSRNGFAANATVSHTGSYDSSILPAISEKIDAWTRLDLGFSYDFSSRFEDRALGGTRVSLNLRNVFDEQAPFVLTTDGLNYDPSNASLEGRYVSVGFVSSF